MRALHALPLLLAFGACCVMDSIEYYGSRHFTKPPEIWVTEGEYRLRLYETAGEAVGFSFAHAHETGDDVEVWVSVRHSSGSKPERLLKLGIPVKEGRERRFFWRDPDGSLHEMKIRR
jgi:hypothetical protein